MRASVTSPAEDPAYLSSQLITYLGNKRALLGPIGEQILRVRERLGGRKLACADLFAGSGAVSRLLKGHSTLLLANDLETYSALIGTCYLTNREDFPREECEALLQRLRTRLEEPLAEGIIAQNYAPRDDGHIRPGERVFYTRDNALRIDTLRGEIAAFPPELQPFFMAPLLAEASVHNNTGGVFKGFYKDSRTGLGKFGGNGGNALSRILGPIEPRLPVLSRFSCETRVLRQDAAGLPGVLPRLDLAYLDPPYNQHPYGSNYFMLNLIAENRLPDKLSPVSGIPADWNRSDYNKQARALDALGTLAAGLDARFLLISYNSEGFIPLDKMEALLSAMGRVERRDIRYNAYRASRNLAGRETYVSEYLFLVDKEG